MNLAIAVETHKHPANQNDYKVWYLELNCENDVVGLGVLTKDELVQSLFEDYQKKGVSQWRAFKKGAQKSTKIELYDFISRNSEENTHFGNLPCLSEFQKVLDSLQMNFELRSIA